MSALRLTSIRVDRMPGTPVQSAFELEDLSPGVNVVHGPNASGKTTTARAIHALLWPRTANERALIEATADIEALSYRVQLDARRVRWLRDGAAVNAPEIPPAESRNQYMLALEELTKVDGSDFARLIERETLGGYDVPGAAKNLAFSPSISRSKLLAADLKAAREALHAARREVDALKADESRLATLDAERTRAVEAQQRLHVWRRAVERLDAIERRDAAQAAVDAYPPAMERVAGSEDARLDGIEKELVALREAADAARARIATAMTMRLESRLTGPLPDDLLPVLQGYLDVAVARESDHGSASAAADGARKARDLARDRIGDAVASEQLEELPQAALKELEDFARHAAEVADRHQALSSQLAALGEPDSREDANVLRDGIRVLRHWLLASDAVVAERLRPPKLLAAAAVLALVVLGVVLVLTGTRPIGVAAVAVGLVVGLLVLLWPSGASRREEATRDFQQTRARAPENWTADAVERRLAEMEQELGRAEVAAAAEARRAIVREQLQEAERELSAVEEERTAHAIRLGVPPATGAAELYVLACRIAAWEAAQRELKANEARVVGFVKDRDSVLHRAAERLAPFDEVVPACAAELRGARAALEERGRRLHEADMVIATEGKALEDAVKRAGGLATERTGIFERLGVEEDSALVKALCEQRPAYRAALDALTKSQGELEGKERALAGYGPLVPDVEALGREELVRRQSEDEAEAGGLERVSNAIAIIRDALEKAREAHDVEAALAREYAAKEALEDVRDANVLSVVGACIADYVQRDTADRDRPPVFHKARELFAGVTAGRYRLDLDGSDSAFRAFDSVTGDTLELEELSSGTRVQLLLSVRVAFVETQERGIRLPLLLDETLATSDDARAHAVMKAVVELCRAGRQIFYFTAQPDEVGKWSGILADCGLPFAIVDLSRARRIAATPELAVVGPPRPHLPDPALDHPSYGAALPVPALDPWSRTGADAAHLWYLCDDVPYLHWLLEQGIERWGQLRLLADRVAAVNASAYERTQVQARALEALLKGWREGRGRIVDRDALERSEAVSEAMLDRVLVVCAQVEGDAEALLEALREGKASGFQTKKREVLEEFLTEEGYLDARPRLAADELLNRVVEAAGLCPVEIFPLLSRTGLWREGAPATFAGVEPG